MKINPGDKFILGKHILMYGDSLKLTDVNKLLGGQKAEMIFTDPPYSVNYVPDSGIRAGKGVSKMGGIMNDINFDSLRLLEMIDTGIVKGAVYLCCGNEQYGKIYSWAHKKFKRRPIMIIWVKNGYGILTKDYHSQYENIAYFYYDKKKFRGERNQTDVWFFKRRATGKYVHPTMKPVAMIQRAIENSSDKGDIVLDLFGGSGSTMIACENTDRRCYMMELDPNYVDVIIKRWENRTGDQAQKINELIKKGV